MHRSARLIAISANTHEVRVLVYGLARPEEEGDLFPRKTNGFIRLKVSAGSIQRVSGKLICCAQGEVEYSVCGV